jgi:hypothetical protein
MPPEKRWSCWKKNLDAAYSMLNLRLFQISRPKSVSRIWDQLRCPDRPETSTQRKKITLTKKFPSVNRKKSSTANQPSVSMALSLCRIFHPDLPVE